MPRAPPATHPCDHRRAVANRCASSRAEVLPRPSALRSWLSSAPREPWETGRVVGKVNARGEIVPETAPSKWQSSQASQALQSVRCVKKGLLPGTAYTFRVKAVDEDGRGVWGPLATPLATLVDHAPPPAPPVPPPPPELGPRAPARDGGGGAPGCRPPSLPPSDARERAGRAAASKGEVLTARAAARAQEARAQDAA
eukprot:3039632-Prymnesium_polylepis.1